MSHLFLDTRAGRVRLYVSGDLQFDERDERQYHEPLALVPVALAGRRAPGRALRVLILGGGDGLALREVLRFPEVVEAHLVDHDPEMLRLGREALAPLNRGALGNPRARVHVADAREFLARAREFDVLIYDLTYADDVAGAALLSVPCFHAARAALSPTGVLAVNAVSPERTPEAFGCVGATLGVSGLSALPYAFALPSFLAEGYGRWGFLFASARPIGHAEVRRLAFPAGTELTPDTLLAGTRLPVGAARAMRVAPNHTDELLYYLFNATPLPWEPPLRSLRFAPARGRMGPRLTAAQGFARWLREPRGRRSLESLLGCLPLSQRGQTRAALLEWSQQAELLFREMDLRAFVEHALRRANELPRAWRRELRALRERVTDGLPPMRDLLEQAYRVFAVYLLLLLLANLAFPDNLYAKGFTSSSGVRSPGGVSMSSSDSSGPFYGFHFSDPTTRFSPYRHRVGGYGARYAGPGGQVIDPQGREYPAQRFAFTDPQRGTQPVSALLALTAELQLLESGMLAYAAGVPGYQGLLEPGRLRILDAGGREVVALLPGRALDDEARRQLDAQGPLLERAVAEHRRWLDWVRWGSVTPQGREAASEMQRLEGIRRAVDDARNAWQSAPPSALVLPRPGWVSVFPGIYLEPRVGNPLGPAVALIAPEGQVRSRSLAPPAALTDEDRFLFRVLSRRVADERDLLLKDALARWVEAHGEALGVGPGLAAPPGSRP